MVSRSVDMNLERLQIGPTITAGALRRLDEEDENIPNSGRIDGINGIGNVNMKNKLNEINNFHSKN